MAGPASLTKDLFQRNGSVVDVHEFRCLNAAQKTLFKRTNVSLITRRLLETYPSQFSMSLMENLLEPGP
jgi:hypothetical protein